MTLNRAKGVHIMTYVSLKNLEALKKMAIIAGNKTPLEKEDIIRGFRRYTRTKYSVPTQVLDLTSGHLMECFVCYTLGILQHLGVVRSIDVASYLDANQIDFRINGVDFQLKYDWDAETNAYTECLYGIPVVAIPSVRRSHVEYVVFSEVLEEMLLKARVPQQAITNVWATTDLFDACDEIWVWLAK